MFKSNREKLNSPGINPSFFSTWQKMLEEFQVNSDTYADISPIVAERLSQLSIKENPDGSILKDHLVAQIKKYIGEIIGESKKLSDEQFTILRSVASLTGMVGITPEELFDEEALLDLVTAKNYDVKADNRLESPPRMGQNTLPSDFTEVLDGQNSPKDVDEGL